MLSRESFLGYLKNELNRSQATIDDYNEDLSLFESFFKGLSETLTWETVDSDVIRDWMEQMMDKGNKVSGSAFIRKRLRVYTLHNSKKQ